MLCTFTTKDGTLIIRSDDIREICDDPKDGTYLRWEAGGALHLATISGTASENRDRIQQEELDLIARIEDHRQQLQQRMQAGYPAVPVQRGKQVR